MIFAERKLMMEEPNETEERSSGEPRLTSTTYTAECLPENHQEETANNHQKESVTRDSDLPLKQTSNVSGTNSFDPSSDMAHLVIPSFEPLKKEPETIPDQLQDSTPVKPVDAQAVDGLTTLSESRKFEETVLILPTELNHANDGGGTEKKSPETATSPKPVKGVYINRGIIDTAAPFESVKEAVSKFGGIVDWKIHKQITMERRKLVQSELERMQAEIPECKRQSEEAEESKAQVLRELDQTNRIIEELKLNLEKAQMEESQAKQDSELAQLRTKEMEQGIISESSAAAKQQLYVAKARHEAAVAEMKAVKTKLKALQVECASLVNERDAATRKAEAAISSVKEMDQKAEELTLELITTKESLESAHAAHLEAEEHRIGAALAREQDCLTWEKELKHAEEEVQQLNQQLLLTKDLKSKLETASALLFNLKAELESYMELKLNQESMEDKLSNDIEESKNTENNSLQALALIRKEIEEVKSNTAKAKDEVGCLRVAASSLKSELDREKASLANLQQREGMASIAVTSLETELDRTKQELEMVRAKEKEAREKMVQLPKLLQEAAREADEAKSSAQAAREELRKSKEEAEQAKASASTIEIRLKAAMKEMEAARASEKLALAAFKALEESEQASSVCGDDSPHSVTLPLDEYFNLSERAHEAEQLAHERVTAAIEQIEVAKKSESKTLEKLHEAYREMKEQQEALRTASEKAEKAKEGKLGAEQELRKWRADHERRRRASNEAKVTVNPQKSPTNIIDQPGGPQNSMKEEKGVAFHSMSDPKRYIPEDSAGNNVQDAKTPKQKKSLVPKMVLFTGTKKSRPIK